MNAQLETERLILLPFAAEHAGALHELWNEPGVRRFLFDDQVVPRARVDEAIASSRASFDQRGFGLWAAFPRQTGERSGALDALLGFTGFHEFHEPPVLELLFGVHPDHWGRGLASELARRMIGHAFDELGFERVVASTDAPNSASVRVMEKSGLRFAARSERAGVDTITYALDARDRPRAG